MLPSPPESISSKNNTRSGEGRRCTKHGYLGVKCMEVGCWVGLPYVNTYIRTYVRRYLHTCIHVSSHPYMCVYICVYPEICMHACTGPLLSTGTADMACNKLARLEAMLFTKLTLRQGRGSDRAITQWVQVPTCYIHRPKSRDIGTTLRPRYIP